MKTIAFYLLFIFFPSTLLFAQKVDNSIQKQIHLLTKEEGLENAAISFMVYNLEKDSVIAAFHENMAIPPASTVKLFTTATALEILGKDYTPRTELYYDGEIDTSGVLHGNLIIKSLGDVSLGSRFFTDAETRDDFLKEWFQMIDEKGIKSITGRVISDGSAFGYHGIPDGWSWSDMGNYYGAGPSASAIYDNMTILHFSTSNQLGGSTSIDSMTPQVPGMEIYNQVTTYNSTRDNAYIYGAPYSYNRFAIGNLPRNRKNFEVKASLPDPELVLAQTVENTLKNKGISIHGKAIGMRSMQIHKNEDFTIPIPYEELNKIGVYEGKSVGDLVYWTNLRSVNLFAEQLIYLAAFEANKSNDFRENMRFINQFWESKLGVKMFQTDGSGLSRSNAFSANHYIQLLKYMYKSKNFETFDASLPVAGESGTLKSISRGQAAQGKVKAKTGTLNRVRAFSGYADSKSGDKLAFSILINNYTLSNAQLNKQIERVFNEIANW